VLKRSPLDNDFDDGPVGTILVFNHDADAAELVGRLIEHAGFGALRFGDPAGLVGQLAEGGVTAVVIDALGTGISAAFELLDAIRADQAGRETPVIILAATDTNRLYAYQSGVDAFVVRPFHADELIEAVRTTIARSVDERERFRREQLDAGGATG
jgi:DNA-binding response OmpR family regulator